jgi:hypothetical protein
MTIIKRYIIDVVVNQGGAVRSTTMATISEGADVARRMYDHRRQDSWSPQDPDK